MMLSGLCWLLSVVGQAAMAELDDDAPLREALLEAGMRLEEGEITEEEYGRIEEHVLERLREILERREAGAGPIALGESQAGESITTEASIVGDFHAPAPAVAPRRRSTRRAARDR